MIASPSLRSGMLPLERHVCTDAWRARAQSDSCRAFVFLLFVLSVRSCRRESGGLYSKEACRWWVLFSIFVELVELAGSMLSSTDPNLFLKRL